MIITWTKWIEKRCSYSDFLVSLYGIYYRETIKKEIELAEIKDTDKILCIGGGSIPSTAIQIANLTNAEIDVIDMDYNAVISAKRIVNRIGLNEQVSILHCKGEDIDVSLYDVIHVAMQVCPKEEVVDHLFRNSKIGTRIIVRIPKEKLRFFYSNLSNKFINKIKNYIRTCPLNTSFNTMSQALLIVKS